MWKGGQEGNGHDCGAVFGHQGEDPSPSLFQFSRAKASISGFLPPTNGRAMQRVVEPQETLHRNTRACACIASDDSLQRQHQRQWVLPCISALSMLPLSMRLRGSFPCFTVADNTAENPLVLCTWKTALQLPVSFKKGFSTSVLPPPPKHTPLCSLRFPFIQATNAERQVQDLSQGDLSRRCLLEAAAELH